MRKRWSSITMGQSDSLREQTDNKNGKQTEDNSRERGVETQQRAAVQRGYPEDAEDPMVVPPDYDIRQSGSFLELQNRDFWLRPTDMSWHLPIHLTFGKKLSKTIVQGCPRNEGPRRTRSRRPRSRRPREAMMNGIMPTGNHHLGHGNNQQPGLRLHLHLDNNGSSPCEL